MIQTSRTNLTQTHNLFLLQSWKRSGLPKYFQAYCQERALLVLSPGPFILSNTVTGEPNLLKYPQTAHKKHGWVREVLQNG